MCVCVCECMYIHTHTHVYPDMRLRTCVRETVRNIPFVPTPYFPVLWSLSVNPGQSPCFPDTKEEKQCETKVNAATHTKPVCSIP